MPSTIFPPETRAQVEPEAVALTPEEQAQVDLTYEQLKPEAIEAARNYVLNRTPANYQDAMMEKIDADFPAEEGTKASRFEDPRRPVGGQPPPYPQPTPDRPGEPGYPIRQGEPVVTSPGYPAANQPGFDPRGPQRSPLA